MLADAPNARYSRHSNRKWGILRAELRAIVRRTWKWCASTSRAIRFIGESLTIICSFSGLTRLQFLDSSAIRYYGNCAHFGIVIDVWAGSHNLYVIDIQPIWLKLNATHCYRKKYLFVKSSD